MTDYEASFLKVIFVKMHLTIDVEITTQQQTNQLN